MVYAHEASLKALHDNVSDFVSRTANLVNGLSRTLAPLIRNSPARGRY